MALGIVGGVVVCAAWPNGRRLIWLRRDAFARDTLASASRIWGTQSPRRLATLWLLLDCVRIAVAARSVVGDRRLGRGLSGARGVFCIVGGNLCMFTSVACAATSPPGATVESCRCGDVDRLGVFASGSDI